MPIHNRAEPAALAADCANEQGKFWEYHDKLFANQKGLEDTNLKQYAVDLGLDATKFNQCLDSAKYKADVQNDAKEGQEVGVTGTPAFFINGRFLSGAQPFDGFKAIIDDELARG